MKRIPDGTGRTLFIAALTGTIFAAFLLVSPKLAAIGADQATDVAGESVGATPTTTTVAVTTTTTTPAPTTTSPTTTTLPAITTTTSPDLTGMTLERGYDGSVALALSAEGPLDGKESAIITDGDQVTWRFQITNTTDERLWGVFVWLEVVGRAVCPDHRLEPGASMECTLTSRAVAGDYTAEAWVDAWTSTRQVKDKVFLPFRVLAP